MADPRRVGRPSKLAPDVLATILAHVRRVGFTKHAARAAGIGQSTFHDWMRRGRAEAAGEYRDFYEAVTAARAQAAQTLLGHVAGAEDWRAAAWLLERLFPKDFALRQVLEHIGKDGGAIQHEHKHDVDVDALYLALQERRARRGGGSEPGGAAGAPP
jgi:hypothetical protein